MAFLTKLAFFVDGILAGLFVCSGMVEHAARTLERDSWLAYKLAKEVVFAAVMPPISAVAVILTAIATYATSSIAWGAAVALLIVALAITAIVHLPLNKQFNAWTPKSMPTSWDDGRRKWRLWNWVRIVFAVAAFALVAFQ